MLIEADSISNDVSASPSYDGSAQNDVDFNVVSIVPFVDFDGNLELRHSLASPLAKAVTLQCPASTAPREELVIDWISHDDAYFDVVVVEDVRRMQFDTPRVA